MIGLGKNIIYTQHWFGYTEMTVQVYLLVSVIGLTGLFPTASAPLYTMPCTHTLASFPIHHMEETRSFIEQWHVQVPDTGVFWEDSREYL